MSIGDFLDDTGAWLSRLSDSVAPFTHPGSPESVTKLAGAYAESRQEAAAKGQQVNEAGFLLGQVFKPLGVALEPATHLPGWDNFVQVIDAPRRAIDTVLISSQHADARGAAQGQWTDWGEMFNRATWSRAWDMADFHNADRVTGGQIVANSFGDRASELDPFDVAEAADLQKRANSTWYGRTMSTTVDLGTSLISLPGTGMLARGRSAAGINTIADAERVAQRFNDVGVVGRTTAQKAKDTLHLAVPTGPQHVDALVARQIEGLKEFDGQLDEFQNFNALKSRLETAPDGDVKNLANVFTQINRVADPAARERLRMNTFLAALGSGTAKRALIEEAPLLARNFEGLTSSPRETAVMGELYAMRLDGEDLPINDVIESVWNTKADLAEREALKANIRERATALRDHNRLVGELRALKPKSYQTPEGRHVQAKRDELNDQVRKLQAELRDAKMQLHGTRRWAAGAGKQAKGVGATDDVVDFNQAVGESRRRVEEVQARLDAAVSDRKLLNETPVTDPTALEDWRAMIGEARAERSGLADALTAAKTERQALDAQIAAKRTEIAAVRPNLQRENGLITDILNIGGKDSDLALVGDAKPTALNRLKQHMREQIGADHYVLNGDGNTIVRLRSLPNRAARMALAPQARGSISLNEVGLGARQLADAMARSGVFKEAEIAAARNGLIREQGLNQVGVVSRIQEQMVERLAYNHFVDRYPGITPEEAAKRAREVTGLTMKSWGKGNDWVTKASTEQIKDGQVFVRDAEGQWVGFDGPSLRSQLADNAPFLDPWDFKRALETHERTFRANIRNGMSTVANVHDFAVGIWKVGALLRPGLMVRSMLDTGPRALASLSAGETLAATYNGMANVLHNRGLRGLARVPFVGMKLDEAAAKATYLGLKPVKVGGHEWSFARDVTDLQAMLSATSKGQTVHGALFHEMAKKYDSLQLDRASWKRSKADSGLWHVAFKEYADMLLASPTARKLAELVTREGDNFDPATFGEQIKSWPEFTREYRQYAQPMGRSRSEFLQQVTHEVSMMFPNARVLEAAKKGTLTRGVVDREFPLGQRFDVPSPEMSSLSDVRFNALKQGVDRAFRVLLDQPDMWLARNPVAVQLYNRRVKMEYEALLRDHGPDFELSPKDIAKIDGRARNAAIGYVRQTFFDTTRYTGAHRALARFSPFIAAWEDAMISWGRLIYDDPRRLTKLVAAYHAPYTVASSNNLDLVVNENGQPITRGSDADQVMVVVPLGALGRKIGVHDYRIRLDAINSIAQGETWWLPGVGPSVALPATYALGSGKVISREAALEIADTDNPLGKAMLKSVFLGGEIPASDPGTLATSMVPGWMRTAITQGMTTGKTRTRQTAFNHYVAEALAEGRTLTDRDYEQLWDRADRAANAAAVTRLVSGFGLGLTGTASVDGQFYADQLHIIYAMTPEDRGGLTPEEFFAKEYPEAADLDWSITKNETGIAASVNAAKSEARLQPLLRQPQNKDVGWMIVGRDNVVDTEFSGTAYAMQRSDGNRTYKSADEASLDAQAAVAERQARTWSQQIADSLVAQGEDPETVETSAKYRTARTAIRQYLMQTNPAYAKSQSEIVRKFDYYLTQARRLSTGALKGRSDMETFRLYDQARTDVMNQYGIKSFSGTQPQYLQAKAVMWQVGQQLAARDLGFQQMWDRFLEREVDDGTDGR